MFGGRFSSHTNTMMFLNSHSAFLSRSCTCLDNNSLLCFVKKSNTIIETQGMTQTPV